MACSRLSDSSDSERPRRSFSVSRETVAPRASRKHFITARSVPLSETWAPSGATSSLTRRSSFQLWTWSLAAATRQHPQVAVGASPRAELDLVQLARARALLLGRDYVIPEDVKSLAVPSIAHRISLRPEMWVRRVHGSDVVEELLRRLPVPRTNG